MKERDAHFPRWLFLEGFPWLVRSHPSDVRLSLTFQSKWLFLSFSLSVLLHCLYHLPYCEIITYLTFTWVSSLVWELCEGNNLVDRAHCCNPHSDAQRIIVEWWVDWLIEWMKNWKNWFASQEKQCRCTGTQEDLYPNLGSITY